MRDKKILVVDDEKKICDLLKAYLEKDGYSVIVAHDGKQALDLVKTQNPDLVVLDLNLPGMDGLDVCKTLRSWSKVPVIMLTARDEETDKIVGLELGADDYVTKPFSPREVIARVKAVLRRLEEGKQSDDYISVGDLVLDMAQHEATYTGKQLQLTPREFNLLAVLARNQGRVYTRLQLLEQAFNEYYEGYERTVDAHIKNIRQKLTKLAPAASNPLVTVHGVGYKFEKE